MKLTFGFSPCPNDTYMFDALVNKKIDISGFDLEILIKDVEDLNKRAFESELDISKISFHAYAYIADKYQILDSGSALGYKNGPLLISKRKIYPDELNDLCIAIPGKYTTANLLLSIASPEVKDKQEYLFSDIEEVLLSDEADAGLIIHENRFTYASKGLKLILDLGEWWEQETQMPIPLGCIVVKRLLPENIKTKINSLLKSSILYANKYPNETIPFIKKYAVNIDENVIKQHINLYVNEYSIDLGIKGREAIKTLYKKAGELDIIPSPPANIFIN